MKIMLCLLTAFATTWFLTPLIRLLAIRYGIMDRPGSRKIHREPTPYLGGVAILAGFLATLPFYIQFSSPGRIIILGAVLTVALGVADDVWNLRPRIKLLGQVAIALLTCIGGVSIGFVTNPVSSGLIYLGWFAFPLTIFWIISFMNTMNLVDGLDGLATGIAAISFFILSLIALNLEQYPVAFLTIAILGACLGFLRYNFAPAQIFLGDAGSMLLGYLLATTAITGVLKSALAFPMAVPIFVLAVPIFDTVDAILRRLKNRRPIFSGDTEHVHHRLMALGLEAKHAVLVIYLLSMIFGAAAFFISWMNSAIGLAIGISVLFGFWLIYRVLRKNPQKFIEKWRSKPNE